MSEHKEPIPSMIYNASIGGHVTNSQQIIDENENKEQSQINAEVKQTLGQGDSVDNRISKVKNDIIGGASSDGNTLKKIEDRVSPLELAVGPGGSVDYRIAAAKSEIKGNVTSACDTLSKAEVKINANTAAINANTISISAESSRAQAEEEQLRILYNNLQQSHPIPITELPTTGEEGKIYRLAGTTSYSDYMWNGIQFIKMATYNNAIDDKPIEGSENLVKSGGIFDSLNNLDNAIVAETARATAAEDKIIFDVSAHNDGAVFESLQSLLNSSNLNILIPTSVRHGGMSIRFVQSSDNKYVQYRLMLSIFTAAQFTNTSNWQGVDGELTAGSENLVKSGVVNKAILELDSEIGSVIKSPDTGTKNGINSGVWSLGITLFAGHKYIITLQSSSETIESNNYVGAYDYTNNVKLYSINPAQWLTGFVFKVTPIESFVLGVRTQTSVAVLTSVNYTIYDLTVTDTLNSLKSDITAEETRALTVESQLDKDIELKEMYVTGKNVMTINGKRYNISGELDNVSTWHCSELISLSDFPDIDKVGGFYIQKGNLSKPKDGASILFFNAQKQVILTSHYDFVAPRLIHYTKSQLANVVYVAFNGLVSDGDVSFLGFGSVEVKNYVEILIDNLRTIVDNNASADNSRLTALETFKSNTDGQLSYLNNIQKTISIGGYRITDYRPTNIPSYSVRATVQVTGINGTISFLDNNWRVNAMFSFEDGVTTDIVIPPYATHVIVATTDNVPVSEDTLVKVSVSYSNKYLNYAEYKNFRDNEKLSSIISTMSRSNLGSGGTPDTNYKPLVLSCLTDIHNDDFVTKKYIDIFNNNKDYITDMLGLGDYVESSLANFDTKYMLSNISGFNKVLKAVGNHDAYDKWPNPAVVAENIVYSKFFADDISEWGVVYTQDKCFFYKDYDDSHIRLVVLDCMHWDEDNDNNGQIAWLEDILYGSSPNSAVSKGYHVIIATHILIKNSVSGKIVGFERCPFVEKDIIITADTGYESIPSIVNTFQTTHNGNFVCYLIGHAHRDFVGTFENYPNQISIIQACSGGLDSWRDNSWATWSEWAVRFNIVSVDYTMKYIRVYRVGEDYDRNMQHKVSMLLSYDKNVTNKFIL